MNCARKRSIGESDGEGDQIEAIGESHGSDGVTYEAVSQSREEVRAIRDGMREDMVASREGV